MLKFLIVIILFISVSISTCIACQITLSEKLFIPKKGSISGVNFGQHCSSDQTHQIVQQLTTYQGKIKNTYLLKNIQVAHLAITNGESVTEFIQLEPLVNDQIKNKKLKDIQFENSLIHSMLKLEDQIYVDCSKCLDSGKNNATLIINKKTGEEIRIPFSVFLEEASTAYQVTSTILAFSNNIDTNSLKEISTGEIPHYSFFTDISNLHFYKNNKQLNPGDFLKKSDLTPINLVRAGFKTEINLENKFVKIKLYGQSKSNGGFGETVEVYQREKNKVYIGKVIDENKVMVKL